MLLTLYIHYIIYLFTLLQVVGCQTVVEEEEG